MEIKITDAAQSYLKEKEIDHKLILLSLDDGSSKFSDLGGSCAIGNKFQLVISQQSDPDFTIKLENNANLLIFTSSQEELYLSDGLTLDYTNGLLRLSDNSQLIDGAMSIQYLGDKIQ